MAYADLAARRGHKVTLFEAAAEIGGQFNLAKKIPGKEEFYETLRYFHWMIELHRIDLRLNTRVTASDFLGEDFDHVAVATGIAPRIPEIEGIDHPMGASYGDVVRGAGLSAKRSL